MIQSYSNLISIMHSISRRLFMVAAATSLTALHGAAVGAEPEAGTLRDVYKKHFLVGVALSAWTINGRDSKNSDFAGQQRDCLRILRPGVKGSIE